MAAPEHKDYGGSFLSTGLDCSVSECFPALLGVAGGLAVFYRECGVEQQHALARPGCQRTVGGELKHRLTLQFFENVAQAGGDFHAFSHRKSQPFGLAGPVVRVLAQNDNAHVRQRRAVQSAQGLGWVDGGLRGLALGQKAGDCPALRAGKKLVYRGLPVGRNGPGGGLQGLRSRQRGFQT